MDLVPRQKHRFSSGAELSFITAGDRSRPAILLLHGFPSSASTFRDVVPELSKHAFVVAPDLPGFGSSDPLSRASFQAFGDLILSLLDHLAVGPRYVYLHDFGAPVGFHVAMEREDKVLGIIVQNANAHRTGFGPGWLDTQAFWSDPDPENEARATAHLTFEGIRDQYVAGVPAEVAARIPSSSWETDWAVMQLPGRMATQRALIADYKTYVARFDAIADYLKRNQPPALMLWGRHDAFFDLAETLSWMKALPRMESHIFDGGHFLLETHAAESAELMVRFVRRLEARRRLSGDKPLQQRTDASPVVASGMFGVV